MRNATYCFEIAKCIIRLQVPEEMMIEQQFQPFRCNKTEGNVITFLPQDYLPEIRGVDLVTEEDVTFSEYKMNGKYIRTFHGTGTKQAYAMLVQVRQEQWECRYLKEYGYHFTTIDSCFRHIALERILMENQAMILHASLIQANGGILFTGVSGIGKSTQAELWKENENAEILNGDRTILRKEHGIWYGYGSPYAGSSKIYRNQGVPIKAIVSLGQSSEEDRCEYLGAGNAFKQIYSGLTINTWNRQFMDTVMGLVSDLCINIPVIYMKCRAQKSAVTCLKKMLEEL